MSDPFIWWYLLLPLAGAGLVLGVLWLFVRKRSPRAKRIALVVSAASPSLFWLGVLASRENGHLTLVDWMLGLGLVLLIMVGGYFAFRDWEGLVQASRERAAGPTGAGPERQRRLERRAAISLVLLAVVLYAGSIWLWGRG